jgi:large repetitive protein
VALELQTVVRGSAPQRLTLGEGRTRVPARPGSEFKIVDDAGKVIPGTSVKRVDNNLVVEGLPGGRSVEITDFFTACAPSGESSCALSMTELGSTAGPITPASDPIAALPDGSFLLYGGANPGAPAALSAPIIAAADNSWKAIGAGIGGLAIAGLAAGAGGGGGGGGSTQDTTAPPPPAFTSKSALNGLAPTFTGTAEAGARVLVRIDVNQNGNPGDAGDVSFETIALADGTWRISTGDQAPVQGTWSGRLVDGQSYVVSAIARDAAGNLSAATNTTIAIDATAPTAPIVGVIAGDSVVNRAESLAGVAVSGTGEAGATVTVVWGGTTKTGTVAADGTWSLLFGTTELPQSQGASVVSTTLTDEAGNVSPTVSRVVVIDTVAPAAPAVTSGALTNLALPTFTGTAEANNKVRVSIDLAGDGSIDAVYETTVLATGSWSVDTETPAAGTTLVSGSMGAGLADKVGITLVPNALSVVAIDAAGNAGIATASTISRDSTIPAAPTIDTVAGDNIVNFAERGTITITGSLPADSAGQPVTVTWGGTAKTVTATAQTFSVAFTVGEIPPDGAALVTAVSQSATGVQGVLRTLVVVVDGTVPAAPSVVLTAGSDSGTLGDNITNDTTPTVRVLLNGTGATAPVAGDIVRLTVGGTQVGTATLSAGDIGATFVDVTTTALAAGSRTIATTVTDAAGNTSAAGNLTLTIDTSTPGAPVPTLTAGSDSGATGDLITNDTTPTVRVSFTGAAAGDVVTLTVGGSQVGTATLTGGNIGAGFVDITTSALADGPRTIAATVTTGAGNVSPTGNLTLTIDSTTPAAPGVTLTAGSDSGTPGDNITNDTTPTVRVALNGTGATAPVAGDIVRLTVGGTQVGTATLSAGDIGATFVDVTTTALAAGSRTIATTVTDAAGNTSAAGNLTLTIDTSTPGAPVPTLTVASNSGSTADLVTNDPTPTIRVDIPGAAVGDIVTLTVGGTTVGTATLTGGDITATFVNITTSVLADGARTISATVTNGAGNVSAAGTLALTIDSTAPFAPSIALTAASDTGTAGDFITLDTTPTFRVTLNGSGATAPAAGDVVALTVGGLTVGTATLTGTDITNDFVDITTSALTPGAAQQTVSVTAQDIAGNTSTASTLLVTISNDATAPDAPTLALAPISDTGTPGDGITNDATPVVRVTFTGAGATAPVAGDFVQLTVGGAAAGTATLTGTNITNGFVDITSTVALANGVATSVGATIRDIPGNTSTAGSTTLTADTTPPPALVAGTNFTFTITDDLVATYTDINTAITTGTPTNPDTSPLVSFNLITAIGAGESIVINRGTLLGGASVDILTVTATGTVTNNATLAGNTGTAEAYVYRADYVDNAGNRTQLDIDAAGADNLYVIRVA